MKMLITLEPHGTFGSDLAFYHCLDTGTCIQDGDEASPSITCSPSGRGQLVQFLITLEAHGKF